MLQRSSSEAPFGRAHFSSLKNPQVSWDVTCITHYSERPSPKCYATDEGRLTSLNPTAALRRCR